MERRKSKCVYAGSVPIGGGAPVTVQSMLNVPSNQIGENAAQALELEEYTHGVQNTIRPGQHHILAASSEESSIRMERLNRYQQQKGCENLLLTPAKTQGAGILNLAHTGQAYTVFMELLPVFHVFSALGSEALGINCDLPKFDDFYGVMDTKL